MINVILYEPEIPENTGNIARTCVAFNARLHLIRPYGFILNSSEVKRSGLDYWKNLQLFEYDCYQDFLNINKPTKIYMYTRYGTKSPENVKYDFTDDIYVMFGKESSGIDKQLLKDNKQNLIRVPTSSNVRSINLSNTVAIALYEIVKQNNYDNLCKLEPHKKLT